MTTFKRILTASAVAALIAGGALAESDPSAVTNMETNPSGQVLAQTPTEQAVPQTADQQGSTTMAQTGSDSTGTGATATQTDPSTATAETGSTSTDGSMAQPSTDVAQGGASPSGTTETGTATDPAGMTEIAEIAVANQPVENGTITIASAYMPEAGFVALHELTNQQLSPDAVGHAALNKGENQDVSVKIDGTLPDDAILVAMLHTDTGKTGTYEFGAQSMNVDQPETVNGTPIGVPFLVLAQADPSGQTATPMSSKDVAPQAQTN